MGRASKNNRGTFLDRMAERAMWKIKVEIKSNNQKNVRNTTIQ